MLGTRVNNYEIVSLLGEGGMGAVYLAEHPVIGRKAAIKVLRKEHADDPQVVERFINEARAANAIRHPNIIDIIDVGRLPSSVPYLMMELLEGESLASRIARGPLSIAEAVGVACQTAAAVSAAHGKGIVHRDLKPDNLFLVADEVHGSRVKVLDFGIAKLRGGLAGGVGKTLTGSILGTPPYMSPEQCRGDSDHIDHRTDIYALGIILYEMLAGGPPFVAKEWLDIAVMHLTHEPPPLRERNPGVPEELEAVIHRALAKGPGDRWASMAEMAAALQEAVPSGVPRTSLRSSASGVSSSGGIQPASGGTALLPAASTTLRSATGELERALDAAMNVGRRGPIDRTPWLRRRWAMTAAVSVGTLAAIVLVARRSAGPISLDAVSPSAGAATAAVSRPGALLPPAALPPVPAVLADPTVVPSPPTKDVDTGSRPSSEEQTVGTERADDKTQGAPPLVPVTPALGHRGASAAGGQTKPISPLRPAGSSARLRSPAKPGCTPNFILDEEGNKHFKTECF